MNSTKEIETAGTFLQGHIETTKAELVSVFGEPMNYEDSKVTIEWGIRFEDGTIATIYDWKRYEKGTPKDDELMTYNIGGFNSRAVELVNLAIKNNKFLQEREDALSQMFAKLDAIKPFTVGQMKKALEGLSDETQILVGGTENCSFDWANLSLDYEHPNEEEGFSALTFYIKDDYDPRQF